MCMYFHARDNTHLRREIGVLKDKHIRQQRVLNKVLHYSCTPHVVTSLDWTHNWSMVYSNVSFSIDAHHWEFHANNPVILVNYPSFIKFDITFTFYLFLLCSDYPVSGAHGVQRETPCKENQKVCDRYTMYTKHTYTISKWLWLDLLTSPQ